MAHLLLYIFGSGTLAALHCLQRAKSCQVARSENHSLKHFQRSRLVCFKKTNHKLTHVCVMQAQDESLFLRNITLALLHCWISQHFWWRFHFYPCKVECIHDVWISWSKIFSNGFQKSFKWLITVALNSVQKASALALLLNLAWRMLCDTKTLVTLVNECTMINHMITSSPDYETAAVNICNTPVIIVHSKKRQLKPCVF